MSERKFEVCVVHTGKQRLRYQPVGGEEALKSMQTLQGRGCHVFALTSANGIEEKLTLQEMNDVYGTSTNTHDELSSTQPAVHDTQTANAGLLPSELARPRALVIVQGGVAEVVCDDGLDVFIFDMDEANVSASCELHGTLNEQQAGGIPARFSDLENPNCVAGAAPGTVVPGTPLEGEQSRLRVLVTVNGGVAEAVGDEAVDVVVFDWDNYKERQEDTFEDAGVPERFADLARPAGIPVESAHFIFSPSELAAGEGAGFWSNDDGWTELAGATTFTAAQIPLMCLPVAAAGDARWISQGEAGLLASTNDDQVQEQAHRSGEGHNAPG